MQSHACFALAAGLFMTAAAVGAAPEPSRCRAVADVLASLFEYERGMQDLILDMGAANGLSEAEMADLRANAADRQTMLDLALDVSARYATAPKPSQDMLAAADNTPVSDLTAELTACAEVADSTAGSIAYQVDYPGNDIAGRDIAGGDWQSCQAMCRAEPQCVAWTLYTPPRGTVGGCWLKHTQGPAQPNPHTISGTR